MKVAAMQRASGRVSELMKVLGSENRLLVLCYLTEGERSVGELMDLVGLRQAALSQHLAVLRREGLVTTRRDGQAIYYRLAREDCTQLLEFLYETFCDARRSPVKVRAR